MDALVVSGDNGRLRWQCRRGMKELDVLLTRYLERDLPAASCGERMLFADVLSWSDPELAQYLLAGDTHPDAATRKLIERLRTP